LGYEVGSGVMIGIPGQTWEDLARDIALFATLRLDMIGVGPYVAHPETPLVAEADELKATEEEQVPADELTTYKVIALARLLCPRANIPSTTALAAIGGEEGRDLGLERGANVVMPTVTPMRYRSLYEIYPGKACLDEDADEYASCLRRRIAQLGRDIGSGPGNSPSFDQRRRIP
jgi:biotin synthase